MVRTILGIKQIVYELLEIITVGFPFCAFKIIAGLSFGFLPLVILGTADLVFNFINLAGLLTFRVRLTDSCSFTFLIRVIKRPRAERANSWRNLGNSIDLLLCFILVAFFLGTGRLMILPENHLYFWNLSVILNVVGAGLGRLSESIRALQ